MNAGATTLWEDWSGFMSHDHPMFGGVTAALFGGILGIRADEPGYGKESIRPQIPEKLEWVRGSIRVDAGEIRVDFDRRRSPRFIITVPDMPASFEGNALKPGENVFE